MTAQIIDGKAVAAAVRAEVKEEVAKLRAQGRVPGLATVLVGARPDSVSYVTSKRQSCAELGIESFHHELPETVSQADLLALVKQLSPTRVSTVSWCSCPCPSISMRKSSSTRSISTRMWMGSIR